MKNTNQTSPTLAQPTNSANFECRRKDDLVTYLYDEATPAERASFEAHLNECAPCSEELNAFGRVRDELTTWQVGFAPRTELVLPRGRMEVLREFITLFPVWARSLGVVGVAAAAILLALSVASARIRVNKGAWGISFGSASTRAEPQGVTAPTQQEIESLVKNAVAAEREKMQQDYQAQFASFKQQLDAEHKARLQALSAEHQARLEAAKASLRQEIRKTNLQRGSIRSFFALDDDRQDSWGDVK